jgi:DNA-binding MarR family transcriptional regulator
LAAQARVIELHRKFLSQNYDLAVGEFDMIATLGNTAGLRMGELASKMIASPANATRIASRLEKRGMVIRRRSQESDREVVASLTPEGEAFFAKHFLDIVGFTRDTMASTLDPDQLEQLAELCQRVRETE